MKISSTVPNSVYQFTDYTTETIRVSLGQSSSTLQPGDDFSASGCLSLLCRINLLTSGIASALTTSARKMEGDTFSSLSDGIQVDPKVMQTFQKSFLQVQDILDQNRLLINEINQNHESRIPDNLSRNVSLIRELNNNIRRVVDLYADLSSSVMRTVDSTSEGESKSYGKSTPKRIRSG